MAAEGGRYCAQIFGTISVAVINRQNPIVPFSGCLSRRACRRAVQNELTANFSTASEISVKNERKCKINDRSRNGHAFHRDISLFRSLPTNPPNMSVKLPPPLKKCATRRAVLSATVTCFTLLSALSAHASSWTGGTANWNSNGNPGWNGTGVPDAVGAAADFTTNGNSGFTATLVAPITLGSLSYGGTGNGAFTLSPGANSVTFNNGGSGALVSNFSAGTGSRISLNSASYVLADSLTIRNTNSNIVGTQSILTGGSTVISGTGNLILSNVSNSLSDGVISLGGNSTFTGNVLIEKGAVIYSSSSTGLGNSSNVITLGSAGNGSASLISTSNNTTATLANNIIVASGAGGTLLLGSNAAGTANTIYSGSVVLNGNLTVTSERTGVNDVRFTNVISGAGTLTTSGGGNISLRGANTYSGNTVIGGGQFTLTDNAQLTFVIGANGINNGMSGTANQTSILDGDFRFDLSGAAANGAWNIVDVASLNQTFGSTFLVTSTLGAFTEDTNVWTLINGATTYNFSEVTGILTATTVPEPGVSALVGVGLALVLFRRRR